MKKKFHYLYGIYAELFVAVILSCCFYKIIAHRYKNVCGEIDLVAIKGKSIIFIEVKARRRFAHFEIVSSRQLQRVKNAAKLFLAKHSAYCNYDVRFDVIYLFGLFQIKRIKNVDA